MWGFRSRWTPSSGFTLLEVIGVLAVIATLLSILIPNVIEQIDRAARDAEAQTLRAIGQGVEAYVRQNRACFIRTTCAYWTLWRI